MECCTNNTAHIKVHLASLYDLMVNDLLQFVWNLSKFSIDFKHYNFFTRWLMSSNYTWILQCDYCNCVASMYYLHLVKKSTYWLCCMVLDLASSIYEIWWKTHKHVWWFFQCLIKNVWYFSRWTVMFRDIEIHEC